MLQFLARQDHASMPMEPDAYTLLVCTASQSGHSNLVLKLVDTSKFEKTPEVLNAELMAAEQTGDSRRLKALYLNTELRENEHALLSFFRGFNSLGDLWSLELVFERLTAMQCVSPEILRTYSNMVGRLGAPEDRQRS
eukprot:TRINITY_DN18705_c0_g1_i1.p1 TRINITY_DN18705_c0_g1~~TRINITY_DN18705_c0_g1_i1.p1  ORF type:complete len:138 (+),score=10.85 TRINITY_DN18705_c0_g1_i1:404-817(+)